MPDWRPAASRLMSLVEAIANVAVGYGVAVVTQTLVFPLFGLTATLPQDLGIGAIFTAVSLVSSYALRRAFEAIRRSASGWCNSVRSWSTVAASCRRTLKDVLNEDQRRNRLHAGRG